MGVKRGGNPNGTPKNLIKNCDRSPEERKEMARRAGIESGKVRRQRKKYKDILDDLLCKEANPDLVLEAAKKMIKDNVTVDEALGIVAVAKALNGDFNFWKEIRETLEGKDAQIVELKGKLTLEDYLKKAQGKSDY